MCRLGDVLYVGLGMYFMRVWGCIVFRFEDVFLIGLGLYCMNVWGCIL